MNEFKMEELRMKKIILALALAFTFATGITGGFGEAKASEAISTQELSEIDTIYQFEDSYMDSLIMNTADGLRVLKLNGATDTELDDYAKKAMSKYRYDFGGRLNKQEEKLFNSNIGKATLCLSNAKYAIKYTSQNYVGDAHNNNADAFRHTIWNYGMVVDVGYEFAKKWGDAHENGANNQPDIEKRMDLFNNSVGLQLGLDNSNTVSHNIFISKSKDKVSNGYCRILKDGNLVRSDKLGLK